MEEAYLHLIWQLKRLPFHKMHLNNGESFRIQFTGNYNRTESGPDFHNARIRIGELEWFGSVEMHVRSSDWYRHGHQFDEAFNNVILHVVYEHDRDVFINGCKVPVLELKEHLDQLHYALYKKLTSRHVVLPCKNELPAIDRVYVRKMLERLVIERIYRSYELLGTDYDRRDPSRLFFIMLCGAFGMKVNAEPLIQLGEKVPFHAFRKMGSADRSDLIMMLSGLDHQDDHNMLMRQVSMVKRYTDVLPSPVPWPSYKRKGFRPASDPLKRVQQLAVLASTLNYDLFDGKLNVKALSEHLYDAVRKSNGNCKEKNSKITRTVTRQIFINALVPFVFVQGKVKGREEDCVAAIEMLDALPPEENHVIRFWKDLGITPLSALESQGLLELEKYYCQRKKCLNCTIGIKVLSG